MPARVPKLQQRLVIARLLTRLVQIITAGYVGSEMFGSSADEAMLMTAIFIGQAERRPMTAAKLAAYAGIPRATVVRKLQRMASVGLITSPDGHPALTIERLADPKMLAAVEACVAEIHSAASKLSKLDTKPIAARDPN